MVKEIVQYPPLSEIVILGIILGIMYFIIFYGMYRDMKVKKQRDYDKFKKEKSEYEEKLNETFERWSG